MGGGLAPIRTSTPLTQLQSPRAQLILYPNSALERLAVVQHHHRPVQPSMSAATAYVLRPLERNPPSTPGDALEGAFRIHLSQKELKSHGLTNGDLVRLYAPDGFKGYAVAWPASQTNPGNKPIAKVTDVLRDQYQLALTDPVTIEKGTTSAKPLRCIQVSLAQPSVQSPRFCSTDEFLYWVRPALGRASQRNSLLHGPA